MKQHTLEPTGSRMDMTDNDSTLASQGEQTTNSSKGRKLRQVLQRKQLDVLLQTYSSYIDESEDNNDGGAMADRDFYSIARKSSLEGNLGIPLPRSTGSMPTKYASSSPSKQQQRLVVHDVDDNSNRARMRKSQSLITDEDWYAESVAGDYGSTGSTADAYDYPDYSSGDDEETEDESDFAVTDSKKGSRKQLKESRGRKQKKNMTDKEKKQADLKARLAKVNEAVRGFSSRAAKKHMEIAEDFQQVTMELRHHLKSGANIVFEELADQFDGIVENLFVGDNNEQRDDDGPQAPSQSQSANQSRQGTPQIHDPNFHPLSHDETIEEMNKQVSELLQPVKVLTYNVHTNIAGCTGTQNDFVEGNENRDLPVSSLASF